MNTVIEKLKTQGFHQSREILSAYTGTDWLQYITINPYYYHRTKVYSNDDFEVFVITWNTKQQSKIHDHASNGCYMLVLQGDLIEEITTEDEKVIRVSQYNHEKGNNISYIDNSVGYHRILNPSSENIAVSLHIYSPPNHIAKLLG
jgi:cysteine dioxygenase